MFGDLDVNAVRWFLVGLFLVGLYVVSSTCSPSKKRGLARTTPSQSVLIPQSPIIAESPANAQGGSPQDPGRSTEKVPIDDRATISSRGGDSTPRPLATKRSHQEQPPPLPEFRSEGTYEVDLGLVLDFEELRPLIDLCTDLGELEELRPALEAVTDLEHLREALEQRGIVVFRGCPVAAETER